MKQILVWGLFGEYQIPATYRIFLDALDGPPIKVCDGICTSISTGGEFTPRYNDPPALVIDRAVQDAAGVHLFVRLNDPNSGRINVEIKYAEPDTGGWKQAYHVTGVGESDQYSREIVWNAKADGFRNGATTILLTPKDGENTGRSVTSETLYLEYESKPVITELELYADKKDIPVSFRISDADTTEAVKLSVKLEYDLQDGLGWRAAKDAVLTHEVFLNEKNFLVWKSFKDFQIDAYSDLPDHKPCLVRLVPYDGAKDRFYELRPGVPDQVKKNIFNLNKLPVITNFKPLQAQLENSQYFCNDILFTYKLTDAENDPCKVRFEYDLHDNTETTDIDKSNWRVTSNIDEVKEENGETLFVWHSANDFPGVKKNVSFRLTPNDGREDQDGTPAVWGFAVDNTNHAPTLEIISAKAVGGKAVIDYKIFDPDVNDRCTTSLEFSYDDGKTWVKQENLEGDWYQLIPWNKIIRNIWNYMTGQKLVMGDLPWDSLYGMMRGNTLLATSIPWNEYLRNKIETLKSNMKELYEVFKMLEPTFGSIVVRLTTTDSSGANDCKVKEIIMPNWDINISYYDNKNPNINIIDSYLPGYDNNGKPVLDDNDGSYEQKINVCIVARDTANKDSSFNDNQFTVDLSETTAYPGFCGNRNFTKNATEYNYEDDFVLYDGNNIYPVSMFQKKPIDNKTLWFSIGCRDYAASTYIVVHDGAKVKKILIPKNSDASAEDHIPDVWENNTKLFGVIGDLSDMYDCDTGKNLTDQYQKGDGITAIEEYRGMFVYNSDYTKYTYTKLHPYEKDAFIEYDIDNGDEQYKKIYNNLERIIDFNIYTYVVKPNNGIVCPYSDIKLHNIGEKQKTMCFINTRLNPNQSGDSNGAYWNNGLPIKIDMICIDEKIRNNYNVNAAEYTKTLIAHEFGHRLTLKHTYDDYIIQGNNCVLQKEKDNLVSNVNAAIINSYRGSSLTFDLRAIIKCKVNVKKQVNGYGSLMDIIGYDRKIRYYKNGVLVTDQIEPYFKKDRKEYIFNIDMNDYDIINQELVISLDTESYDAYSNIYDINDITKNTYLIVPIYHGNMHIMNPIINPSNPQKGLLVKYSNGVTFDLNYNIQLKDGIRVRYDKNHEYVY